MGEKEAEKKEGGNEAAAGAGPTAVVLKVDLHCEGCAQKVKKSLKHLNGVESVKADYAASKLTVIGKVDPVAVKARVEEKTKKKVDLLSPQPAKKDNAGDAKKSDEKSEKKPDEGKKPEENKPKEVPVTTVVLKTRVHCDGCAHKMKKIINKCEGVQDVSVDLSKDQIAIKGTMGVKEMLPYLNAKLKRVVEVAPPQAKKDGGGGDAGGGKKAKEEAKPATGGDKEAKKGADGGGDKKGGAKPEAAGGGEGGSKASEESSGKVEIMNKMEHHGYPHGYGPQFYNPMQTPESGFVSEYWHAPPNAHEMPYAQAPPPYGHAPPPYGHAPPPYMHTAPQMFSDENPNACSVM